MCSQKSLPTALLKLPMFWHWSARNQTSSSARQISFRKQVRVFAAEDGQGSPPLSSSGTAAARAHLFPHTCPWWWDGSMHAVSVDSMRKLKPSSFKWSQTTVLQGLPSPAFLQPHSPFPLPNSLVLVILAFAKKITRCRSQAVTARKEVCLLLGTAFEFYSHSVTSYLSIL